VLGKGGGMTVWFTNVLKGINDFYSSLPRPVMDLIKIILIIFIAALIVKVGSFVIKRILERQKSFKNIDIKKVDTMSSLLISVFRYAVYIMSGVVILTDVFKMTSVLAAAGIGGIAIGFGAQSLIKDIIAGMFIVMEDQYAVGDLITIGDMNGTVERLELRVTKLRNFNGDLYIIPNGEIKKVINHTRGNKAVIVDIPIAHSVDIDKAFAIAEEVCSDVAKEFDVIVEQPRVQGITELTDRNLNLRIFARTRPNAQGEVERRIKKLIKERFSKEKIAFF
jgi:small-conductance mechanosensitive channel